MAKVIFFVACGAVLLVGMAAWASPQPRETAQETGSDANALSITVSNAFGQAYYSLTCDPAGGTAPDPASLCRAIQNQPDAMLEQKGPHCWGGTFTIHLHVSGTWDGKGVDAYVDNCTGNPAGEDLWMSDLPEPPTGSLDVPGPDFFGSAPGG